MSAAITRLLMKTTKKNTSGMRKTSSLLWTVKGEKLKMNTFPKCKDSMSIKSFLLQRVSTKKWYRSSRMMRRCSLMMSTSKKKLKKSTTILRFKLFKFNTWLPLQMFKRKFYLILRAKRLLLRESLMKTLSTCQLIS